MYKPKTLGNEMKHKNKFSQIFETIVFALRCITRKALENELG
jgi:hypothetical protein